MHYHVYQKIIIQDIVQNEMISEKLYFHGNYTCPFVNIGISFITPALGLKEFDIVLDSRLEPQKHRVVDMEINIVKGHEEITVYLEPLTLIIGQHDVGECN